MAKISMRLVPDQTPDEVYKQLVQYMEENAPEGVTWEIKVEHGGNPSISKVLPTARNATCTEPALTRLPLL